METNKRQCGIVVMTGNRKNNTLFHLAGQLETMGIPYVVSHGTIGRDNLKGVKSGTILTLPNLEHIQVLSANRQVTLNYAHALRVGASYSAMKTSTPTPFIVLEDDVVLSKNFTSLLSHVYSLYLTELEQNGINAVISIYTLERTTLSERANLGFVSIDHCQFDGVCAMVYPSHKVAFELATRLEERMFQQEIPYDQNLVMCCKDMGISMFKTSFSLVRRVKGSLFIDNSDNSNALLKWQN